MQHLPTLWQRAQRSVIHQRRRRKQLEPAIILMVPAPQVEDVLFGDNGVEKNLTAGGAAWKIGYRHEFDLANRDQSNCSAN